MKTKKKAKKKAKKLSISVQNLYLSPHFKVTTIEDLVNNENPAC